MSEHPVKHIIEEIGPEVISARLGVSEYSVRHAKVSRAFPSSWFDEVEKMCLERGIDCPRSVFKFRSHSEVGADGDAA